MAQMYNNAVLTDQGADLLARSQIEGFALTFTRVATGNGIYTDKSVEALKQRTELMSQRQTFPLQSMGVYEEASVRITTILTNVELTVGYYLNEIGLFARAGDDPETEVLYSIAVTSADQGDYFPPYNGHSPAEIIQSFVVTVSNDTTVEVVVPSGVYALASDVGDVSDLETQDKSSTVNAINEILSLFDNLGLSVEDGKIKQTITI